MRTFLVYKSSAGSGKTYTLVREYLLLALVDPQQLQKQYRSILAITFTNKAAAEMKERIIRALRDLSAQQADILNNSIRQQLNIDQVELARRARIVLTDILHHYSDFSIGTIDSFTHRIIRTFAPDLKLPVNFQIETDVNHVFGKVISLLLNELGRDKALTDYLVQYSLSQAEENKNWNPERGLLQFINDIYKEGKAEIVASLQQLSLADFDTLKKSIASQIRDHQQILKRLGEQALQTIASQQLTAEDLYMGSKGIYSFFKKLVAGDKIGLDDLYNSTIRKALEEDKWYGGKASAVTVSSIDNIKPVLLSLAHTAIDKVARDETRYTLLQLVYKNIYAMGLVNELAKLTAQFKAEENILFISEFNERISAIISQEPTPFIYERLGDKYQHFLLDEFQDTSTLQWQNILPLLDNSLANGQVNMVVGDGKQSIYRWRNANVEQFTSLPGIKGAETNSILHERQQTLERNISHQLLDTNYRSQPGIVTFNNALFDHIASRFLHDDLKKIYDLQAQKYKNGEDGYVTIDFPGEEEPDKDAVNCRLVLQYIVEARQAGYQYYDICIIVRRNQAGNTVANYLIQQGIPVVSSESLLLQNALEVNVLVSFLKYMANEKDLVSASVVLSYLHQSGMISEESYTGYLKDLNMPTGSNLFGILNACGISIHKSSLQLKNIYDICVEVSHLLMLNKRNPAYIRFFLDEVLSFLVSNTSNINLFAEWWERRADKASVVMPEGMNAVSVMTVHKSKGLEFPVVITPYVDGAFMQTERIWVKLEEDGIELPVALIDTSKAADQTRYKTDAEKERQFQVLDAINVLYVDFTRAVDRLHIISWKKDAVLKDEPKHIQAWLYDFAGRQDGFDPESHILTWGKPGNKPHKDHAPAMGEWEINSLLFNHQSKAIEIKGGASYFVAEELEKAREYGVLVHYILSRVSTMADIQPAIQKALLNGDISEEEAVHMARDIFALVQTPALVPYFSGVYVIKNETEILTADGEVLRPDRIVIDGATAVVIDYKTGKRNPAKYHFQMKQYEGALRGLGYTAVKKLLVYLHEQDIEEVL